MSNHLGHELQIHKEVYRLQESSIEAGKVSKLLLALEQGNIQNIKGKNLDEIQEDGKSLGKDGILLSKLPYTSQDGY